MNFHAYLARDKSLSNTFLFYNWKPPVGYKVKYKDYLIIFSFPSKYKCFSIKNHGTGKVSFGSIAKSEIDFFGMMVLN